ncbi:DUF2971 domain-containing protein [Paraburkholderia sediminicola]|uniref:DUF2971 domain-containing protein n=1 Tax=Paraburkholderia sediminicola TaxID=458836 RepID=UPI0038BA2066
MKNSENLISHRFLPINENLISSIVEGYLYFSNPENFNDPYDCHISLKTSIENARRKASGVQRQILDVYTEDLLNRMEADVTRVGVVCFSKSLSNTLMWAHYAKNHSGLVVTYEIPPSFILDNVSEILGWSEVSYGNNLIERFFLSLLPNEVKSHFENFIGPLLIKLLSTKAPAWRYEREFRIVKATPGRFDIEKSWIKQICFGLGTKAEHINLIKQLIAKHGYENVTFARMTRHSSHDFGFRPLRLAAQ